jgi:ABC-2 type transport system permease protein
MRETLAIARREFGGYFATPVALVFIIIFLALQGALTFNLGQFFERNQADLVPFFNFLPWVLLLLVPALTMRLWPVTQTQAVIGKFLAAWAFTIIALALTFPFVLTVNYLGHPDNGIIACGYLGAVLLAGSFLAIGGAISASTKNQVVAFVLAVALCFLAVVASTTLVVDFLSKTAPAMAAIASRVSISDRYEDFTRGLIEARDVIYFASVIAFFLFLNSVVIDHKRAS